MDSSIALPLLLITFGAMLTPMLARTLALPLAVVEIAYGVMIGPHGLGLADPAVPFVHTLADLGFAFFLFLTGLEVDVPLLRQRGRRAMAGLILLSLVSFVLSGGVAARLGWGMWTALALGATSVPLLVSVLRELDLVRSPTGASLIAGAAVGEVVTVALMSVMSVVSSAGGPLEALVGLGRLSGLILVLWIGTGVLRLALWWRPEPFLRMVASHDPNEIGVRAGFGVMFAMIAVALLTGVEAVMGAFLGGLMVGGVVHDRGALEDKLGSMAWGFFVPVFFVHVGMRLELDARLITEDAGWLLGMAGVMLGVKLLPQLLLLTRGASLRAVAAGALLYAAPLTLVIAVMDLAQRVGQVDTHTESAVIAAGMLASLAFPSLARRLLATAA
ncbi:MAG TPA: cation:proton antiporter [Myxococcota bacterium]|nr:cation:proton antiporter [Myxococcota bacterium]